MVPPAGMDAELPHATIAFVAAETDVAATELISDVVLRYETSHSWKFDDDWREDLAGPPFRRLSA